MNYLRPALLALLVFATYVRLPVFAAEGPQIEHFTSSSPTISGGEAVTLSWRLGGGEARSVRLLEAEQTGAGQTGAGQTGIEQPGTVSGQSVRLEPALSQVYTLVAQNRAGSAQQERLVQVQAPSGGAQPGPVGSPEGADTGSASGGASGSGLPPLPRGSFGISPDPGGPFVNDAAGGIVDLEDARVIQVAPEGEFFAEVSYRDPDGIAEVALNLVNSSPENLAGTLSPDRPPFSVVGAPTGNCDLGRLPTVVRCIFRIVVAEGTQNIDALPGAGSEFAYVFRVRVTDGLGNVANRPVRGYVEVTE